MNDPSTSESPEKPLPKARVTKPRPAWLLWLVPVGAAALCVWFIYRDFVAAGPLITILFRDAEGLEAGNTAVNYRGAQVGVVKDLALTKNDEYVKVKVRLVSSAKNLARSGSVFWIVRPELKVGTISGLRTIISGEYVTVQPGNGAPTNSFKGADEPPIPEQPNSLHLHLITTELGSLREQSPLIYRGIEVGQVQRYQLSANGADVIVEVLIRGEYAPLVRQNTKFWNAGGLDFKFGLLHGAEITAESPATLLTGGIEFATPPESAPAAAEGALFELYSKPAKEWKEWRPSVKLNLPNRAPETTRPSPGSLGQS